jgi:Fur family peroxide stress response transcriptional regulator
MIARKSDASARVDRVQKMLAGVRAAGLKLTPQRIAVVKELACDETHPTAQELFERLRPGLPTMSFATVYNTLGALSSAGLCAALALSPGSGRFDPNMSLHHHLVCDLCGAVRDLPPSALGPAGSADPPSARAVAHASRGFELRSIERIFRGVCAACSRSRPRQKGSG